MIYKKAQIGGAFIVEPELIYDDRGYFTRIFSYESAFKKMSFKIVQVNHSFTLKMGTIRGLHFQKKPFEEAKIVQCLKGKIYDVVLDLRTSSPTFGHWIAEVLSEKNKKMLYVPPGLAQGFQTLTNNCLVQYFMSQFYSPINSGGIKWNDPSFKVSWPIDNPRLSEKDKSWPPFKIGRQLC